MIFIKKFVPFLVFVFALTFNAVFASAATSSVVAKSSAADSIFSNVVDSADFVTIYYAPNEVYRNVYAVYSDSGFSNIIYRGNGVKATNYLTRSELKCDGYWNVRSYNSAGYNTATIKIHVTGTAKGACTEDGSGVGGDDQLGGEDPDDGSGSGSGADCGSVVCECIADLKDATAGVGKDVVNAINDSGQKVVDAVNNNTNVVSGSVNDAKEAIVDSIEDLTSEFQTDKSYPIDDLPNVDEFIDKPSQPSKAFEDNNKYFEDQGDAEKPGALPKAPEPKDWDGVKREDDLKSDDEKQKDSELEKDKFDQDSELEKDKFEQDKFSQDDELQKDKFEQDKFTKDDELSRDQFTQDKFTQDGEMTKDKFDQDSFTQDGEMTKDKFDKDDQLSRTNKFSQTNIMDN